ncbi:hypothetical protein [Acanthopleuribacter pedis]|uniref:Uncharacterized protein n=1 Tax=Acanthopleuribacter pedis TaxID=442870 RepID=A0A8J7U7M9_9BACT|nr:hypothetical protein [Acanthopleuribacter pedis]MBO1323174.1 hypothetical protein [Acanthopleuribacter pedis]
MKTWLCCLLFVCGCLVSAQSDVSGQAPVTLQVGVVGCNGLCDSVDVFVDVTGLAGSQHPAGLNAFVLAFDLSRSDVFASAVAGGDPELAWTFTHTSRDTVDTGNRLVVVGSVAATTAPNQNYQVANILLCGAAGAVTLTFVPEASSLGARLIDGDGPGPIAIQAPAAFNTAITTTFPLTFFTGISAWQTENSDYDLAAPAEVVDILDLVQLSNCGQP